MFTYYIDPGHGWVRVSLEDIADLGLRQNDFSNYSPRRGKYLYLEEDCDAPKFITAWETKNRRKIDLQEVLINHRSQIFGSN